MAHFAPPLVPEEAEEVRSQRTPPLHMDGEVDAVMAEINTSVTEDQEGASLLADEGKGSGPSGPPPSTAPDPQAQAQAPRTGGLPPPPSCPLLEVTCHKCGMKGHYSNKCFNQRCFPPPPPVRSASNAVVKHNPKYARVNMVNLAQAEDSSEVIMGNLSVNSIPARVLFDIGASLSFISRPFSAKHGFVSKDLLKPLSIVSPGKL
jgi:hypothetical protein